MLALVFGCVSKTTNHMESSFLKTYQMHHPSCKVYYTWWNHTNLRLSIFHAKTLHSAVNPHKKMEMKVFLPQWKLTNSMHETNVDIHGASGTEEGCSNAFINLNDTSRVAHSWQRGKLSTQQILGPKWRYQYWGWLHDISG